MHPWSASIARLRQLSFPHDFRIEEGDGDWLDDLAVAVLGGEPAVKAPAGPDQKVAPVPAAAPSVDERFLVDLCNEVFRLCRNVRQIERDGAASAEVRKINRAIGRMEELLERMGVESRDLAGEGYDDGRLDFEPISQPEVDPTVDRITITTCERPRVLRNGALLQKARGLLVRPPEPVTPGGPGPSCPPNTTDTPHP